jgi:hypothetical protein
LIRLSWGLENGCGRVWLLTEDILNMSSGRLCMKPVLFRAKEKKN